MKKNHIIILSAGALVLVIGVSLVGTYNGLVAKSEKTESALSAIDAQYQRRADLIPQLVQTVEQAVTSERNTLNEVVEARAAATSVSLGENPSAETIKAYSDAQANVGGALSKLIAISEAYPDLKSTQGFLDLQNQLEGTENRITVARTDYNDIARSYNTQIASFPTVLIAGAFGHGDKYSYFQASDGADQVPELGFTDK